jgi:hypothetical protein
VGVRADRVARAGHAGDDMTPDAEYVALAVLGVRVIGIVVGLTAER